MWRDYLTWKEGWKRKKVHRVSREDLVVVKNELATGHLVGHGFQSLMWRKKQLCREML